MEQLYNHAGIQIYCGDNVALMSEMDSETVDLTVTSPPYGKLRDYKGYSFDFEGVAQQLFRLTRSGGAAVWVVGDTTENGSESLESFRQALYFRELGFNVETMIYEKDGFRFPTPRRYHNVFEYMFVLSKGSMETVNLLKDRRNLFNESNAKKRAHFKRNKDGSFSPRDAYVPEEYGVRYNVWRYGTGGGKGSSDKIASAHPAVFPDQLAADHIRSWSNEGDVIFDPFLGSGTTLKMAKILKRRGIGIDISEEYCRLAIQRVTQDVLL